MTLKSREISHLYVVVFHLKSLQVYSGSLLLCQFFTLATVCFSKSFPAFWTVTGLRRSLGKPTKSKFSRFLHETNFLIETWNTKYNLRSMSLISVLRQIKSAHIFCYHLGTRLRWKHVCICRSTDSLVGRFELRPKRQAYLSPLRPKSFF